MAEEKKPAEQNAPIAGKEQEVKPDTSQVDYEALYKAQAERASKAEETARNYRKGMLKYKSIAKGTDTEQSSDDEPSVSELVQHEVQRALAETNAEQERIHLEELNLKMARELKEAKLALGNKSATIPTGMGSGEGSQEVKAGFLSQEQETALRKRGWDDERIKKFITNLHKLTK